MTFYVGLLLQRSKKCDVYARSVATRVGEKKLMIPRHSSRLLLLSRISMNAEVTIGNEIVIDLI